MGTSRPGTACWSARTAYLCTAWEESRARDVVFSDAFYFIVGPAMEVERHCDATRTLRAPQGFAQRVAGAVGLERVDLKTHFALWALRRACSATLYGALLQAHLVDWE